MADPLKPAVDWKESLHKSFEELKAEAHAKKMARENLQPLELGKGRYKNIFKVGDRTRPELALSVQRPQEEATGSGEVDLDELIPEQALKDLSDAYAAANMTALGEAQEGVREEITFDSDESEQLRWTGQPKRHLLQPHAREMSAQEPENAAFDPLEGESADPA